MSAIHIDIVDGASVRETKDGYQATRVAKVDGLTGDASARQFQALQLPQMPKRGDSHPTIPGIVVDDRVVSPQALANQIVEVVLTYRALDASEIPGGIASIEIGTSLVTETTSRDIRGNIIVITTNIPELDADGNQIGIEVDQQAATIQKQIPMTTLRFRRKEPREPTEKAMAFTGKIGGWRGIGNSAPRWMCTGISGQSDDGGQTFDVGYEFQHNSGRWGWNAFVEGIDAATGQPYISGAGLEVQIYELADFTLLDLPEPGGLGPQVFF